MGSLFGLSSAAGEVEDFGGNSAISLKVVDNAVRGDDTAEVAARHATSPGFVRRAISARAARRQFFENDLFADPAWDILLELYAARCEQKRVSISSLCIAAAVPSTTALRWIDKLRNDNMVARIPDPLDGRRTWVEISDTAFAAMTAYLTSLPAEARPL